MKSTYKALLPAGRIDPFFRVGFVNRWGDRRTKDGEQADGNEVSVWLVIENPADGVEVWEDFDAELGEVPWWWSEYTDLDLTYVLTGDFDPTTIITWMLTHGIAPMQPFLVNFERPTYSVSYEGEHDIDWSCGVVAVRPWTKTAVLKVWERILKHYEMTMPLLLPPKENET
jgi:hypothetical protein